MPKNVKKTA